MVTTKTYSADGEWEGPGTQTELLTKCVLLTKPVLLGVCS